LSLHHVLHVFLSDRVWIVLVELISHSLEVLNRIELFRRSDCQFLCATTVGSSQSERLRCSSSCPRSICLLSSVNIAVASVQLNILFGTNLAFIILIFSLIIPCLGRIFASIHQTLGHLDILSDQLINI
jgi:hypothetical protein